MKPNFALDFRDTGIALLHRTSRGWQEVGEVAMDAPDLAEGLDYLRSTALGMSPRGFTTKLLIPNSQILYTSVTAPGPDDASRRAQIAAALEGRTPYAVADLAFDWVQGFGDEVRVAVIARETLDEAEGFAAENRLNPVSFAAIPDADAFPGEPWFGPSSVAGRYLTPGQTVQRDDEPVQLLSRLANDAANGLAAGHAAAAAGAETAGDLTVADIPVPEDAVAQSSAEEPAPEQPPVQDPPPPEPPVEVPPISDPAPVDLPELPPVDPPAEIPQDLSISPTRSMDGPADVPADLLPGLTLDLPAEPQVGGPAVPPAGFPAPQPFAASGAEPAPIPEPATAPAVPAASQSRLTITSATPTRIAPEPAAQSEAVADAAQADQADAPFSGAIFPDPSQPDPFAAAPAAMDDEAPMAVDVPLDDTGTADADLPPAPSGAARAAFASRRGPGAGTVGTPGPVAGVTRTAAATPKTPVAGGVPRPASARPITAARDAQPIADLPPLVTKTRDGKSAAARALAGPAVSAATLPGGRKKKSAQPARSAAAAAPAAPAQVAAPAMQGAQGFKPRNMPQPGKPRYLGLILTAVLLLLLVVIAAWSQFFLAADRQSNATVEQADAAMATAVALPQDGDPAPEGEMLADLQDPAEFAAPAEETAPEAIAAEAPPAGVVPDATPGAAAPGAPTGPQDEIFLATADAPPPALDPQGLALPPAAEDAVPAAQMAPPPFGTVYQFDADGRIIPTAQGIVTPEGVTLTAGKPPLLPPVRPESVLAAAAAAIGAANLPAAGAITAEPAAVDTTDAPPAEAIPEVTATAAEPLPPSDPALAGARPRARPAGLAPATDDGAALEAAPEAPGAGATAAAGTDTASLRPRLRPETVLAAGEAARLATASASLVAQPAAGPSALPEGALQISRRPAPRPRDMSRAVEAAVAAAVAQQPRPVPEPEQVAVAQPAPQPPAAKAAPAARTEQEADDEPEMASAAPKIPVSASVAKQATFAKAINLSKINLIGVYGSPSNRYALVRQSNGRYRKVKTGDTLDGGRVTAVTATEVRYQKGSRDLVLAMPKG